MVTVKDVAKACQVSPGTVSNVINNKAIVHPHTRERVLATIRQMHYRPNAVARGLVQKRINALGVVFLHAERPDCTNPFFSAVLDGILSVCTREEQNATLHTIADFFNTETILSRVCDGRSDGVLLLVPPPDWPLVPALSRTGLPFVLVDSYSLDPGVNSLDVDNTGGAFQAVTHLVRQGHRRIAFYATPFELGFEYAQDRLAGYRSALAEAGIVPEPSFQVGSEAELLSALQKAPPGQRPTAIFFVYDQHALIWLARLRERGLRVPDDVSVIGFDDIPAAATGYPPLTTVRQPAAQLGQRAAELLMDLIASKIGDEPKPGVKDCLPTELVIRCSTAPPRAAG